jgi:hypothetical protein
MQLLPLNPWAALDLPQSDRRSLAELLVWSAGSVNAIRIWLKQNGLKGDGPGRTLIRELEYGDKIASLGSIPRDYLFLSWLTLRPPEIKNTFLLVVDEMFRKMDTARNIWLTDFSAKVPTLLVNSIVSKLFTSDASINFGWAQHVFPVWRTEELQGILKSRFSRVGSGKMFDALFGPYPPETLQAIEQRFLDGAHGSLILMLENGNRLIHKHCEEHRDTPYLTQESLDEILRNE